LSIEIWASPEATVARIDATHSRDQLAETGHERRAGDIALLAMLDVDATRYPVLWEKTAPEDPARLDEAWARVRLEALAARSLEPIVTLLHHGSGPAYTSLVDPDFPQHFAAYAGAVADAFPWVRRWTPINEPLTTARFSTLYGHWYPNGSDDHVAFGHALAHQAQGMLLAMEAIRERVPDAVFVFTEALQGFSALDPRAERESAHQRERMYLSLELVMGRVVPGHVLYGYLTEDCNVAAALLARIVERAEAPDVVGWNYYPNSERVLGFDDAGNATDFARVACEPGSISPRPLLVAAHDRLDLPFGLGEVHVHGDEAERVRWLLQRYADLLTLEDEGFPVRMFGAWAAFGAVDWKSHLTRNQDDREDGIFAFAEPGERPRPTAVADAVRTLARGGRPELPETEGWWERRGTFS